MWGLTRGSTLVFSGAQSIQEDFHRDGLRGDAHQQLRGEQLLEF